MRKSKRSISKAKMYGFNPWVDQVDAINQIVSQTGETESAILRTLVDEALVARRQKIAETELAETPSDEGFAEALHTIQTVLLKLVREGETSLRMQDVSLALLQDTLAEARAGRTVAWEQTLLALKDEGVTESEIAKRFEAQTDEAKEFAYGAAQKIKSEQR